MLDVESFEPEDSLAADDEDDDEEDSEDDEVRPLFDDDVPPRESVMYQPLPLKTMPTG